MYGDGSGAHNAPATLGLGLPKGSANPWVGLGHPAGMGYLIKTIRRHNRANLNGFKEDLMAWVTRTEVGLSGWRGYVFGLTHSSLIYPVLMLRCSFNDDGVFP